MFDVDLRENVVECFFMPPLKTSIDQFEIAEKHFNAFADAFLTPDAAERWRALFGGATAAKWQKIDPWWLWDDGRRSSSALFEEISVPVNQIASNKSIRFAQSKEAVVISVGHSKPAVLVKPFGQLTTSEWPLDGIVSLEAGCLAFAINHDGDVLMCRT